MVAYDYIITGLGCAGLSLVYYLLDSPLKDKKILLIDHSSKTENDRTWCYWAEKPLGIHPKNTPLVYWDSISITESKKSISADLQNLKYFHVKSLDFYKEIIEKIKRFPNVSILKDSVEKIESIVGGPVQVLTSKSGVFKSNFLFNSIPFPSQRSENQILKQSFVGWKVSCKNDYFDPSAVSMMHFVTDQQKKTDFFYILPYNKKEALIEYTLYSKNGVEMSEMERKLSEYMESELRESEYEITFKESGSIPMTTFEIPTHQNPNIISIGTLAGCSKPSTGYTFYDIQKHCMSIVSELNKNGTVSSRKWNRKPRFRFYDNIILNIAIKWPGALPDIFRQMFSKNQANLVLKFLHEETNIWEEISLLSRLKFGVFLKSLLNYERH
ncbi:lycopene cyclase family protein [Aquiflexum gelatinilyticum]|uniref:Lycopene cyclase family protein n=1 Tax=Aquiflexum gelatinilyticum TaxID=2961943 RepID=A0A9X2PAI1_9BACT|nr:lycopene cyclase family protein [Aquiflexum gelatinilyticum]MCR9017383.1 lycopene cyclase family protein [Aquiflexum gelatinilyticum]